MVACTECRTAKVKCNQVIPCSRCQRLGKECIPHQSKQGQRVVRRKRSIRTEEQREDAAIAARVIQDGSVIVAKEHYGLQSLVRQWIALAFKRRTFALLDMACKLAMQCGISMDDILCDDKNGERRGMDCLYPCLLVPAGEQTVVGREPLRASDIPVALWRSVGIACQSGVGDTLVVDEAALNDRWIFVRETRRGVSRFYVSPGWEQHVGVTCSMIEQTYIANKQDISDLYLPKPECGTTADSIRGFSQQVLLHERPGTATKPTRINNVRIQILQQTPNETASAGGRVIQQVDQLWVLAIPDLDHTFGLTEYIPKPSSTYEPVISMEDIETMSVDLEESVLDIYDDVHDFLTELLG